jgi:8-amino-7-oxononanoate synthase
MAAKLTKPKPTAQSNLPLADRAAQKLAELAAAHRLRRLEVARGLDFASNDYLKMTSHPRLRETLARAFSDGMPVGAGAARLLRGNHDIIADCEKHLARWLGAPACLLTSSGYQANYLLLSSLPQRGDVVLYDANVHACIRDGIRASNAQSFKFAHHDLDDLKRLLQFHSGEQIFIVTESLFSMDGDFAPIAELHELAIAHGAMLIFDEAHTTGIYGASGKGCCEGMSRDNLITVHTGGKALGAAGGFIAARQDIIDLLINTARPFIFATAPMPVLALALQTATQILDDEPWRRERLLELCIYAGEKIQETRYKKQDYLASCILPLIIGSDESAMRAGSILQAQGFDVRAIRPPTVPEGTARLRISINIGTSEDEIKKLAAAITAASFV